MKVLVTGGAGYIGSTTASALIEAGHTPVILDSLVSGPAAFVRDRIFYRGDIGDRELVRGIFRDHPDIELTVHMAARVVVQESVADPGTYYRENVVKALELFDELIRLERPRVIFSSSAAVYAQPEVGFEVDENARLDPKSPYARTKLVVEMALDDLASAGQLSALSLRYFNPIGSDPGLRSGVHVQWPTHVLGQLLLAARGMRDSFAITGNDYPTRDGTGIRDYVHVWDVALAHVAAVERFDSVVAGAQDSAVLNIGTGTGVTVAELVAAVNAVTGADLPVVRAPRRPGDAVGAFANVDRAGEQLQWRAQHSLEEGIASALAWWDRREEVLGHP